MQLDGASEAEVDFLLKMRVARLATVDARGRPHAVPVCFALVDGRLYSPLDEKPKRMTDRQLQRVRNVLANPSVCLIVDHYAEDWSELAWLQVRGEVTLVEPGGERHQRALAILRERYPQYRQMELEVRPLLEISPTRIVSWQVNR